MSLFTKSIRWRLLFWLTFLVGCVLVGFCHRHWHFSMKEIRTDFISLSGLAPARSAAFPLTLLGCSLRRKKPREIPALISARKEIFVKLIISLSVTTAFWWAGSLPPTC